MSERPAKRLDITITPGTKPSGPRKTPAPPAPPKPPTPPNPPSPPSALPHADTEPELAIPTDSAIELAESEPILEAPPAPEELPEPVDDELPGAPELDSDDFGLFDSSEEDETFVVMDGDELDDLLADEFRLRAVYEEAKEAHAAGIINDKAFAQIQDRVRLLLARCQQVVTDIESYVERKRAAYEAEQRRLEEERKRREEEERRKREEEERKRREAEEAKRLAEERRLAEARRVAEEAERKAREEAERLRREEELRKQREAEAARKLEEAKAKEESLHWREREGIPARIKSIGLEQGAFAVKTLFEEALLHKDWVTVARKLLERYRPTRLPYTWTQIEASGVVKEMLTIFPNNELNPVVVPGLVVCKEGPLTDDEIFVIVNIESPEKMRFSRQSIVKLKDAEAQP